MAPVRAVPTGQQRTFGVDELIVSKTDAKGIITYANRTFQRISGFTEAELIGAPHNIVRHPDMPRCVFKLMWDQIGAGRELFAYVKNLAKDGAAYWVYAHVTPSFGADGAIVGYHSNRRCPEPAAIKSAEAVYEQLRAEEASHPRPADAIAAATERMQVILSGAGLTYDQWVWSITNAAMGASR